MRRVNLTGRARFGLVLLALLVVGTAACSSDGDGDGDGDGGSTVRIVATTTVLGDVARQIVGSDGAVEVLLPIGADPHTFQPSARQLALIESEGTLVIANGLDLEESLLDALDAASADGAVVLYLGDQLDPLPFGEHEDEQHEDEDDGHGHESGLDPHIWLDLDRMAKATGLIATALAEIEPGIDWASRADAYAAELRAADAEARAILEAVPVEQRKLVTNHDSLGYFAERYGFEVVGTVIPGGGTLGDPSSAQLAELVELMEREAITAIFAETIEPDALAEAIAAESDGPVAVVELFTGSLGPPGSEADTLIGMVLTNARRIAGALG